eukprot:4921799-Pyramimonas_sp.AAC.1
MWGITTEQQMRKRVADNDGARKHPPREVRPPPTNSQEPPRPVSLIVLRLSRRHATNPSSSSSNR